MRSKSFHGFGLLAIVILATATGARPAKAQLLFNLIDPGNLQTNNPAAYNGFVQ